MIYFDNAATTIHKPKTVIEAVVEGMTSLGNPSRGAHSASLNSLRRMMETRNAVSDLFNVGNSMNVVFTQNATAALNIAIGGIKGHIITTAAEHNSVLRPLYRRGNFTITSLDAKGRLQLSELEANINKETEAIVMCHASNLTGNVFNIAAVGEICKKHNLKFIVDAAQTAGLLPIDFRACNISALCVSGHKSLYAPQGVGVICLNDSYPPPPIIVGGSGSNSFSTTHPTELPDALEAGTQNMPAICGMLAGIQYVQSLGNTALRDALLLKQHFLAGIQKLNNNYIEANSNNNNMLASNNVKTTNNAETNLNENNARIIVYGDVDATISTPVVALNIVGVDSGKVAAILFEEYDIAVRAGVHCSPLMHKTLGTTQLGAVRFSFSHHNTISEIDFAINAIGKIMLMN